MLDIGVIIQAPMQDKRWLSKCAVMGLIALIPIAGALNLLGWIRAYTEARMRGETDLPEAGFDYMGAGWRMFLSFLPLAGVMLLAYIVVAALVGIGAAANIEALAILGGIVGVIVMLPLGLWVIAFSAAMYYLHIVHNEPWSSIKFGRMWQLARTTGTEYLLLWVAFLVAGVIMQLGAIACFVGLIVSMPYGYAMYGAALAEFAKVTKNA